MLYNTARKKRRIFDIKLMPGLVRKRWKKPVLNLEKKYPLQLGVCQNHVSTVP